MITREETYKRAFEIKNSILKQKKRSYEMLLNSAYEAEPRLKQIDEEKSRLGAAVAIEALSGGKGLKELKTKMDMLSAQKKALLDKAQIAPIKYDCELCGDSGYISGKICECVKRIASEIAYRDMSAEMPLESSTFSNFDLKYYPDENTSEGNPKRRMASVLKFASEYAAGFSPKASPNLLFIGSAGLGKTHLTLAVVSEAVSKGYICVYGPAENLFSKLETEKFSANEQGAYEAMTSCDLLVIDDLGAEISTAFSKSALYNLLNTRLLSGKPTIINTNLSMKEIEERYTARISSRLIGCFKAFKFIGSDVRQQRAVERMNNGE